MGTPRGRTEPRVHGYRRRSLSELGPPAAWDLLNEELGIWEAFRFRELPDSSRQAWWDGFGDGSREVL